MIVRANSLVMPISQFGYLRPLELGGDRNFTYPDGDGGLISGLVANVPAGTDIYPYNGMAVLNSPNCQTITHYEPPRNVKFSGTLTGYIRAHNFEHDAVFTSQGGTQINIWNSVDYDQVIYGTFFQIRIRSQSMTATTSRVSYWYKSSKGCVAVIDEYEQGAAGIVDVGFEGLTVSPVSALRLSDDTFQVLPKGQMYLPAGEGTFYILATCAGAWVNGDKVYAFSINPEIPYGL